MSHVCDNTSQKTSKLHHNISSSLCGSLVTATVMTPLDVLKIRMQTFKLFSQVSCHNYYNVPMEYLCTCGLMESETTSWYKKPIKFFDVFDGRNASFCVYHDGHPSIEDCVRGYLRLSTTFLNILRNEHFSALFRGLSPTIAMSLPQTIIYFTMNEWLKERSGYFSASLNSKEDQSFLNSAIINWSPGIFGGISRVIAVAIISPIELLRTKMQAIPKSQRRLKRIVIFMLKEKGIRSLWTGMGPTLLRDVPYSIIFWSLFDRLKSRHLRDCLPYDDNYLETRNLPFWPAFVFGSFVGFTAGLVTHPFDVVKTNRQVRLGEPYFKDKLHPRSTWLAIRHLYHYDGLRALYVGLAPRMLKNTLASGLMIGIFESLKKYYSQSTI